MRLQTKLLNLTKSTFTPYVAIFLIIIASIFSSMPGKSCEKQDTLKLDSKDFKSIQHQPKCDKNQVKEEQEKFNMMSLNLVYYLMNKFLDTGMTQD